MVARGAAPAAEAGWLAPANGADGVEEEAGFGAYHPVRGGFIQKVPRWRSSV